MYAEVSKSGVDVRWYRLVGQRVTSSPWYAKRDRGGGTEHFLSIEPEPSPRVVSQARCIEQQRKLKAIAAVEGGWYAMPVNPAPNVRRFARPQWDEAPYNAMSQGFLLWEQWWREASTGVRRVAPHHEEVASFVLRQAVDVTSPSNYVLGNPEVLEETLNTAGQNLVRFSPETQQKNQELKAFLHAKLYRHFKMERMRLKARRILIRLFYTYRENPTLLPFKQQERAHAEPLERVICDYIAGMTDRYALEEYRRLFGPEERV